MLRSWQVYCFLLLLLTVRVLVYFLSLPSYKIGEVIKFVTRVESEPKVSMGKQVFRTSRFFVSAPGRPVLHFNDFAEVSGVVQKSNFLRADEVLLTDVYQPNFWEQSASKIRDSFVQSYQSVLPRQQANLLSGVVLGSIGLDVRFKAKLAGVGLTHVVAASGMNITLFSGFVGWLVGCLRLRKIYKAILSMIFIGFYSTITGFEPPIVRAAFMAGFVLVAGLFGRQGSGFWGLLISAYIMLWVSPSLVSSASFLLSFSAMTSQIFLSAFVPQLPGKKNFVMVFFSALRSLFWQSFLAIVFTLPIVLWFFAKFSLISLLSNLLTLWTVEPLMILGGLLGLVGVLSPDLARAVTLPAGPLLGYFVWVVDFLDRDYFVVNFKVSNWMFPAGYYLLLAGFVWWWLAGKGRSGEAGEEKAA